MKAIRIEQYGGPEVLRLQEIPVPVPAEGEVLVRIAHAGINVMDVGTRKGAYATSETYPVRLPTTIGMEGAGTVEQLGADVAGFSPGDRVAYCLVWNSYAEFAVVPAWQLVHVPPAVPLALAAAATFQGFTAHYLATDVGRLGPGRSCLIHAAAGGVGQLLVGFAARLGATVYGTVRNENDKQLALERGAQDVFLSGDGAFVGPVLELTGGTGVHVVFDSVGKPTLRHDFEITRPTGLVVNFGVSGGAVDDLNPAELGEAGSLYLTRPRLKDHLPDAGAIQARADALYSGLADGSLSLSQGRRYTMDEISQAHTDVEERKTKGKPLLDIAPHQPSRPAIAFEGNPGLDQEFADAEREQATVTLTSSPPTHLVMSSSHRPARILPSAWPAPRGMFDSTVACRRSPASSLSPAISSGFHASPLAKRLTPRVIPGRS